MIAFLYELLYILAVSLGAAALFAPAAGLGGIVWAAALAVTLLAGALTAFKNAAWMVRMIMAGAAVTVVSALFFLNRNEALREVFAEHAALLWLPVIAAGAFAAGEMLAHIRPFRLV
ncbi:MAG: hypothetical protein IK096_01880, partial [Lachnospiraceae bacterium]|nr:hypothetical protein [Lachnospiraceae bacterium]